MNNTTVDSYLVDGCGRCDLFKTPQCKVHPWNEALTALRVLILTTPLQETMKWGAPTYTVDGPNAVMLTALRNACCISFLRGALLDDPHGRLERPGPNTHASRVMRFTSAEQVHTERTQIIQWLKDTVALHRAGKKVPPRTATEPMPEALQAMLDANPDVAVAFDALTPGRQRSYRLHVGGAKQAKTRHARAFKCMAKIIAGKGFNER